MEFSPPMRSASADGASSVAINSDYEDSTLAVDSSTAMMDTSSLADSTVFGGGAADYSLHTMDTSSLLGETSRAATAVGLNSTSFPPPETGKDASGGSGVDY